MNTPRGLAILYLFRRCPYAIEARLALAVSAQGSFCPLHGTVCEAAGLYISLNQCSYEPGLGTLPRKRDRLALDEPNAGLPLPT